MLRGLKDCGVFAVCSVITTRHMVAKGRCFSAPDGLFCSIGQCCYFVKQVTPAHCHVRTQSTVSW